MELHIISVQLREEIADTRGELESLRNNVHYRQVKMKYALPTSKNVQTAGQSQYYRNLAHKWEHCCFTRLNCGRRRCQIVGGGGAKLWVEEVPNCGWRRCQIVGGGGAKLWVEEVPNCGQRRCQIVGGGGAKLWAEEVPNCGRRRCQIVGGGGAKLWVEEVPNFEGRAQLHCEKFLPVKGKMLETHLSEMNERSHHLDPPISYEEFVAMVLHHFPYRYQTHWTERHPSDINLFREDLLTYDQIDRLQRQKINRESDHSVYRRGGRWRGPRVRIVTLSNRTPMQLRQVTRPIREEARKIWTYLHLVQLKCHPAEQEEMGVHQVSANMAQGMSTQNHLGFAVHLGRGYFFNHDTLEPHTLAFITASPRGTCGTSNNPVHQNSSYKNRSLKW
ncbi:hypothetical protein PR048_029863 [Dryococelus australis]|uniref:Uncharacterized protein n=1 Tax=Dryococelus australis TaxID=614101 RepID=A0ABQ9GA40_9NEOP|nr:hypothetical protein PR048_029863 [Dryococelus australis]